MKIAAPVSELNGLDSQVHGHFGGAAYFVIAETEDMSFEEFGAEGGAHSGQCNPVGKLGGRQTDAMLVAGIGANALMKLNAAGIRVFRAAQGTVRDNLEYMKNGQLPEFMMSDSCAGHGDGHGGHGHGGCGHNHRHNLN